MVWDAHREEVVMQLSFYRVLHGCFSSLDRVLVLADGINLVVFDCSRWERVAEVLLGKTISKVSNFRACVRWLSLLTAPSL